MTQRLFTKSAFRQALVCPASLYYYYDRENYANQNDGDDFLQALADGGDQVGDLARLYYGITDETFVSTLDSESALAWTERLLQKENVNIAEAAFRWGRCFIRTDILEKRGNVINLIEVKAKSFDEDSSFIKESGATDTSMREYLYDLAFQKYVMQKALNEAHPGKYIIHAYLMLADGTKVAEGPVNQFFRIEKDGRRSRVVRAEGAQILLEQTRVLTAFPADDVCEAIISGEAEEQRQHYKKSGEKDGSPYLGGQTFEEFVDEKSRWYCDHERHYSPLSETCFGCPFWSSEKTPGKRDGKKECFIHEAHFTPEMFDKPQISELNGTGLTHHERSNLMAAGNYLLSDLDEASFNLSRDTVRKYDGLGLTPWHRRLVQMALAGNETLRTYSDSMIDFSDKFISEDVYLDIEGLKAEMNTWVYPLHMIDFETTSVALPLYEGLKPYDQVAFQYSHHVIDRDPVTGRYSIRHDSQYINTEKNHNPNIDFVRHLCEDLSKDEGSIFRYSNHENSILRAIRHQMLESGYDGADRDKLIAFIDSVTKPTKQEKEADSSLQPGPRNMIDLWDVVKKYYMHKSMKGSNSIKQVLPAVLRSSALLQSRYGGGKCLYGSAELPSQNIKPSEAKDWITRDAQGNIENPYKHLDAIAEFLEVSADDLCAYNETSGDDLGGESIANGGAALAAYTKLQFSSDAMTDALKEALLRYCELDTMSMVFIWEYFYEMINK